MIDAMESVIGEIDFVLPAFFVGTWKIKINISEAFWLIINYVNLQSVQTRWIFSMPGLRNI